MADTLVNTLYPPQVETFQPAFVYTDSAVITFSLSPFNVPGDIKYVHISVVDQRNNENALKDTVPWSINAGIFNGILVMKFPTFTNAAGISTEPPFVYDADNDLYSVSISTSWLNQDEGDTVKAKRYVDDENTLDEEGNPVQIIEEIDSHYYNVGQYYKVQIRFDSTSEDIGSQQAASATDSTAAAFIANYMTAQRPYFSEWSEVTLVKPIYPVSLALSKFDVDSEDEEILGFNKGYIRIAGAVSFDGELDYEDNEHLQYYRLLITNVATSRVFLDTGEVYAEKGPDGRYGINYLVDMEAAEEKDRYNLRVFITTNNGYSMYKDYIFDIAEFLDGDFKNVIWNNRDYENHPTEEVRGPKDIVVNQEDGIVYLNISCPECKSPGKLYIKRACSKDGYKNWQIISTTKHKGSDVNIKIVDYTVCSLHSYKYAAQYEYYGGLWSPVEYSNPIYIKFYEMLLERQNRQIAIRYNGQLTSWKPVVNRQKIDTLGGKYPKFVENATLGYKQFAISGIISAEGDFNRKFLNENDGEWIEQTDGNFVYRYYYQNDIQKHNDNFNSSYMIRNDTVADGEFGYEEKKTVDPDGVPAPNQGNLYLGDGDNIYISEKTQRNIADAIATDGEYSKSVFDDSGYALYHQHDLYPHDNWYWEREFRERLVGWLNDGEPKLYRSMPEGNVAVILMDVNLTPLNGSRQLYNFSATLYEVGDGYDLDNLDSLGIIDIPKVATVYVPGSDSGDDSGDEGGDISYAVQKIGQMYEQSVWGRDMVAGSSEGSDEWADFSILERLQAQQAGYLHNTEILPGTLQLTNIKINFVSEPHYFYQTSPSSWTQWADEDTATEEIIDQLWLGYLIKVNGQQVFVNERGYYQVPDSTDVTRLEIAQGDVVVVDYILTYHQQYATSNIPKRTKLYKRIVGQWAGMFPANKAIGEDIYNKYAMTEYNLNADQYSKDTKSPSFIQSLQYWKGICIDVSPYTVVGIKYFGDTSYTIYIVGRTGVLHLLEDTPVDDIVFLGRKMFKVKNDRQDFIDEWEFVLNPVGTYHNENDRTWWEMVNASITDTGELIWINFNDGKNRKPYEGWLTIEDAAADDGYYDDIAEIKEPRYNTVYEIAYEDTYKTYIYYLDDKFYPIEIAEDGEAIAAVPVYGVVNYKGDLVRSEYS